MPEELMRSPNREDSPCGDRPPRLLTFLILYHLDPAGGRLGAFSIREVGPGGLGRIFFDQPDGAPASVFLDAQRFDLEGFENEGDMYRRYVSPFFVRGQ
jgi:hypothetical protein